MQFYDRVPRLLFPFSLMQLFCRKTSSKSESTSSCHLLSMWVKSPFFVHFIERKAHYYWPGSKRRNLKSGSQQSMATTLSSELRQPIRRLHGTEASPGAIRAWRYMRVSWMLQARCRSQAWRTVQISAYYLRFVYVKVHKIRETTKASSLYLPPHPFISLDAERHIFRDS